MIENGGFDKKVRIASYNRKGRLTLDSVYLILVDGDERWQELKDEVYAEHAEMGLTAEITELTDQQWHTILMEKAVDLPEWEDLEQPGCVPERIGSN